jgi:hypothetical protein
MTVSVAVESAVDLQDGGAGVRRNAAFGRWAEIAMLAAAIVVAPLAFILGLAIYAVRRRAR